MPKSLKNKRVLEIGWSWFSHGCLIKRKANLTSIDLAQCQLILLKED